MKRAKGLYTDDELADLLNSWPDVTVKAEHRQRISREIAHEIRVKRSRSDYYLYRSIPEILFVLIGLSITFLLLLLTGLVPGSPFIPLLPMGADLDSSILMVIPALLIMLVTPMIIPIMKIQNSR